MKKITPRRPSDDSLRRRLRQLAKRERAALTDLLETLAAWDADDGPLRSGFSSLFKYCTQELGYSDDAALYRVRAARLAKRFPIILKMLRDGELTLTALVALNPVLNKENAAAILSEASRKPILQVREIVARLRPQPDIRDHIQRLPPNTSPAGAERGEVRPLSPGRFHIGFTAGAETVNKIQLLRELLFHIHPEGRLEDILCACLDDSLRRRAPKTKASRRTARAARPSRRIPAAVKREVFARDGGCCSFVGPDGHRCEERSGLEYDHIVPVAAGGKSVASNLRLLCVGHNQFLARQLFGPAASRFMRH